MSNNDKHKETVGERKVADLKDRDPAFFRELFEMDPTDFRKLLKESPELFPDLREFVKTPAPTAREEIPKEIPKTKRQAEYIPNPALALRFRHSDYNTLNRCVEPAVKLACMMGLRIQGPIFLPSGGWWKGSDVMLNRIAIMLVSGSAETLVRYTKQASSLPRHGARLDIRLERTVAGKPFSPSILMRTTP